jgi:hypothetical protein
MTYRVKRIFELLSRQFLRGIATALDLLYVSLTRSYVCGYHPDWPDEAQSPPIAKFIRFFNRDFHSTLVGFAWKGGNQHK